jgi:hypothetical protein
MNPAINTNIKINGNNTKNQESEEYPALQNVSKSHVKNIIYKNFTKNTLDVLDT